MHYFKQLILIICIAAMMSISSSQAAEGGADKSKLKILNSEKNVTRERVEEVLGKPDKIVQLQNDVDKCKELWIYSYPIMDGFVPLSVDVLYIDFDKGIMCSTEVQNTELGS